MSFLIIRYKNVIKKLFFKAFFCAFFIFDFYSPKSKNQNIFDYKYLCIKILKYFFCIN